MDLLKNMQNILNMYQLFTVFSIWNTIIKYDLDGLYNLGVEPVCMDISSKPSSGSCCPQTKPRLARSHDPSGVWLCSPCLTSCGCAALAAPWLPQAVPTRGFDHPVSSSWKSPWLFAWDPFLSLRSQSRCHCRRASLGPQEQFPCPSCSWFLCPSLTALSNLHSLSLYSFISPPVNKLPEDRGSTCVTMAFLVPCQVSGAWQVSEHWVSESTWQRKRHWSSIKCLVYEVLIDTYCLSLSNRTHSVHS